MEITCRLTSHSRGCYSETCIKRPGLGQKKLSLNRGGLLIEVKMPQLGHDQAVLELRWSLNTGGNKSRFHCILNNAHHLYHR